MAKKFFYVCAGIFLLLGAFALGSVSATAQQGQTDLSIGEVQFRAGVEMAGVINRVLVKGHLSGGGDGGTFLRDFVSTPVPGTATIIAAEPAEGVVLLSNGDIYNYDNGPQSWRLVGNMLDGVVAVPSSQQPTGFGIEVAPNPAMHQVSVTYTLPRASDVSLEVLDAQGRVVQTSRFARGAGRYAEMIGADSRGGGLRPGQYFVRLRAEGFTSTKKVAILQ